MVKIKSMLPSFSFVLIVLASLVVLWPLYHKGFFVSDDGEWMVIRLSAFYQSLRDGQIPTRFLDRLNAGYGYPVSNFLYPGFLYIGSFLHVVGFSFVDSVKLILIGSITGSVCFLYGFLRRRFALWPSTYGALSFLVAPYLGYDIFTRGSVGEILSLLPATAFFYGVSSGKKWLVALSIMLLLISHNSLGLLFFILMLCYVLYTTSWKILPDMLLGIGMAAFFWLPALYERRYVMFDATVVSRVSRYFIQYDTAYLAGPLFLLACIVTIFFIKRRRDDVFFVVLFIVMLLFVTPLSVPLWHLRPFTKLFQFPFRFLALGLIAGPWLVALFTDYIGKKKAKLLGGLAVFSALYPIITLYSSVQFVNRPEGYYTTNEGTTTVSDEYMPRWVQQKPTHRADARLEVHDGNAQIVPYAVSTKRIDATVTSFEESIIQLNTIYYPGWGAMIDGVPVRIDYKNTMGVMRITVPTGEHRFVAEFRETIFRFIADVISILSFIVYCYLLNRSRQSARRIRLLT